MPDLGSESSASAKAVGEAGRHSDESSSSLAELGERLRQARKGRNLSLAELSQSSGVSVAMLSHIERGRATPSLKALDKLRHALGVSMVDLFPASETDRPGREGPVVRADDRQALVFDKIGLTKLKLSPGDRSDLELLLLVISPGGGSGPEPWTRPGEKAGYVLEGAARLEIGGEAYDLGVGDSFQFDSSAPHRFDCVGPETAKILWIIKSDPIAKAVDA
jgi:transcriptional regulator with XRE-family HTH domain